VVSIIIPAHNEEAVIGRCLGSLLADADPGEMEIIVVCNGCQDRTADRARDAADDVVVLETPIASKSNALDLGDRAAHSFPRLFIDADIELGTADLRQLVAALDDGALAASPTLRLDLADSSLLVRSYHAIWQRLPVIRSGLVGRGVYGVSEQGRGRFGEFPDVIADDLFVHRLFEPDERVVVEGAVSVVRAPRTVSDLLLRKRRSRAGSRQLESVVGDLASASDQRSSTDWLEAVRREPRLVVHVPTYVVISLIARMQARRKIRRGDLDTWESDQSSR